MSGSRLAAEVVAHCKRSASVWFCGRFIRTTTEWIQIQVTVYSDASFRTVIYHRYRMFCYMK
jgi:hypothetical protein